MANGGLVLVFGAAGAAIPSRLAPQQTANVTTPTSAGLTSQPRRFHLHVLSHKRVAFHQTAQSATFQRRSPVAYIVAMSNYNPDYRRDAKESPPYSRDNSPDHRSQNRGRSPSGSTLQLPDTKPGGLTVSTPATGAAGSTAYTPYYAAASPTSSPVNTRPNPPSPKAGDKSNYKAYRPPVQQAYSTDSVIPSQPHGPYTAYQPPKPVTSTQLPNVGPPASRPQPSPAISPLLPAAGQVAGDNRPISPPTQSLPSPLSAASPPVGNRPQSLAGSAAQHAPFFNDAAVAPLFSSSGSSKPSTATAYTTPFTTPPPVSDSIVSTPTAYERPAPFPGKPMTQSPPPSVTPPIASGPFTPQGGVYHQQPQQNVPPYGPPKSAQNAPAPQGPSYVPPPASNAAVAAAATAASSAGLALPASPPRGQQAGPKGPVYADPSYQPFSPPVQPKQQQQPTVYTPTPPVAVAIPPPQGQAYAVELPSSPGAPNIPPKPTKQLSFTLPPSDIYAERIANFMNMLEKEASLGPTGSPTVGVPEPDDLETRRNRVFKDWIVSESKLRGPKFATDLADELDSLSFGSKRASEQFSAKPRGSVDIYSSARPTATSYSQSGVPQSTPVSQPAVVQPPPPKVTSIDVTKLLPLIYPPPPPKVSAAVKLAPFQRTFASAAHLAFIEKNREAFAANQTQVEQRIQAEVDEVRRRRGKRNPADAENLVREIRKREGQDAYERFDRDVVTTTYGELMKTGEIIETVKQGVEDIVNDHADTLSPAELLEIFSFVTAVQDFSTTVHNHMESLLTERSMKYMYSLTIPLYESNDAAEAKKIEAWNQGVVAGQVADNKAADEKRAAKYSKFIVETCDQAIAREKSKSAQLTAALTQIVRNVDIGLRDGGRIEFHIPSSEDIRPYDLSEEGKLLWLRSKILVAALAIQASIDSQKALQKTKDVATRLTIKARYAAQEAEAVRQHPTNQQKNIEDINKLREQQSREIDELNKTEELASEARGIEKGRFQASLRPAADTLKERALTVGGERAQNWLRDDRDEALLGWA
ncbi:hypothetical protein Dda_2891 [Drechslerella dactyloides]|uniref:Uncharacterized protein n=1 Tax=Drechslerella dactyloides TaxID=74499 RepID=A0AAD6J0U7_DREDA|nr:hypothetical protein Dda_2891 [Drechslerella dactyloides]